MSGERLTEAIYMVAAGRFLVGRESLHKLPTLDFAIADFKVKLVANDLGKVIHCADRAEHIGRVNDLDGALFRLLTGTANQPLEGCLLYTSMVTVRVSLSSSMALVVLLALTTWAKLSSLV